MFGGKWPPFDRNHNRRAHRHQKAESKQLPIPKNELNFKKM